MNRDSFRPMAWLLWGIVMLMTIPAVARPSLDLRYDPVRDRLDVDIEAVPIAEVAPRLAACTGVRVLLDPRLATTVSAHFANVPLEEALKRILGPMDSAFTYTKGQGERLFVLESVHIFSPGDIAGAPPVVFDGQGAATVAAAGAPVTPTLDAAQRNLELIRRKSAIEMNAIHQSLMSLTTRLSAETSAEGRKKLIGEARRAREEMDRLRRVNAKLVMDEQRNVRLLEADSLPENRREYRQRLLSAVPVETSDAREATP